MMSGFKLASAGDDIKLWDCNGFTYIRQYNPHGSNISSVCWSTDNKILASSSTQGDKIVLSYSDSGAHTREIGPGEKYNCIAFNSTSRYVMGGKADGIISLWDIKTDKLKKSYKDHKSAVTCLQFNWNDTYIAAGSEIGEIILYNVVSGVGSSPMVSPKVQAVRRIEYSHFKKSLLGAVSDDGAVSLWDSIKHRLIHSFTDSHQAPATGLAFSPINEMLLLSVGLDKRIVCYDVHGKSAVRTMTAESPLTSVCMKHDGTTLAVGSMRGKIYLYDLRQGSSPIQTLTAHKSSVQYLAFQNNTKSTKNDVGGKAASKGQAVNQSGARITPSNVKTVNGTDRLQTGLSDKTNSMDNLAVTNDVRKPTDCFSPLQDSSSFTDRSTHSVPPDHKLGQSPQQKDPKSSFTDGVFSPLTNNTLGSSRGHSSAFMSQLSPLARPDSHDTGLSNQDSRVYSTKQHRPSQYSDTKENDISGAGMSAEPHRLQNGPQSAFSVPSVLARSPNTPAVSHQKGDISGRRTPHESPRERTRSSPATTFRPDPDVHTSLTHDNSIAEGATGGIHPFHMSFMRNLLEESLEKFREQIRSDYLNLHMEMIRQFVIQKKEMEEMMSRFSVNDELLAEVERLREENKQLKKKF